MRRTLCCVGLAVLTVASAAAVDVVFRDGSVVHAVSYRVTGSYVMVDLPDGRQVAYAANDVDLDLLKAQEASVEGEGPATASPAGMAGAVAPPGATSSLTISDGDVARVSPEDEEESPAATGPPPGYRLGGQVGLQAMRVEQVEPGVWEANGEVVNRTELTVGDVRVQLELHSEVEGLLASADVPVTSVLEPAAKASFTQRFTVAADKLPRLRGRVFWMQEEPPEGVPAPGERAGRAAAEATDGGGARPTPIS